MCTTCGCSSGAVVTLTHLPQRLGAVSQLTPEAPAPLPPPESTAGAQHEVLHLEENLLAFNDQLARRNRDWFAQHRILALNLVSSPGSGKTALLESTLQTLRPEFPLAVIEGDQATQHDAERIHQTGCPAVQVNTGTGCHLEAQMVWQGVEQLALPEASVLFVENVGNLVCPALFDLGEAAKVAILSVTEGEDKPLKYPHMFQAASVMLLNKVDLLPYVDFDPEQCEAFARQVNPDLQIFRVSARTGEGLDAWHDWIRQQRPEPRP